MDDGFSKELLDQIFAQLDDLDYRVTYLQTHVEIPSDFDNSIMEHIMKFAADIPGLSDYVNMYTGSSDFASWAMAYKDNKFLNSLDQKYVGYNDIGSVTGIIDTRDKTKAADRISEQLGETGVIDMAQLDEYLPIIEAYIDSKTYPFIEAQSDGGGSLPPEYYDTVFDATHQEIPGFAAMAHGYYDQTTKMIPGLTTDYNLQAEVQKAIDTYMNQKNQEDPSQPTSFADYVEGVSDVFSSQQYIKAQDTLKDVPEGYTGNTGIAARFGFDYTTYLEKFENVAKETGKTLDAQDQETIKMYKDFEATQNPKEFAIWKGVDAAGLIEKLLTEQLPNVEPDPTDYSFEATPLSNPFQLQLFGTNSVGGSSFQTLGFNAANGSGAAGQGGDGVPSGQAPGLSPAALIEQQTAELNAAYPALIAATNAAMAAILPATSGLLTVLMGSGDRQDGQQGQTADSGLTTMLSG